MKDPLDYSLQTGSPPVLMGGIIGSICLTIPHTGIKEDDDVRSSMRGIDELILFGNGIGSLVLYDQQESIALKIVQLEFEPSPRISLGLSLYGTADPYDGIYRLGEIFIGSDNP